ncbi:MAG: hypothetical protein A2275_07810 [Bacteroidetes bacterium RIFOXYA12_FULL_35_11]|nr:MAG: hypothetical protein A2X01_18305 [Bacteroidetes bacterium GWF2_35_48]OFY76431.1 MAG: hypothetical protein A2275_07810 [Bacteroidetes bacterium RIFOXYA12_FULL_35_11]OFY94426.1 MAG: hypothetical protein A2309_03160 [Bacteroidetes bacterium RIFOXYB2_FULL_35_7]OFZ00675.1 MAG: hypothetical protein A2491_14960 [Bacteroidetes bacterium RIFOXYC12_FULL_35_7]HBX52426.1 twitching motility protein PilT [Bacteroidales bacterium]
MNGSLLLDTNALIYLSKGQIEILDILKKYSNIYISAITKMEVLGFHFENDNERKTIEKIVNTFEIIHTNNEITDLTILYRKNKKIKIPDAIILATAKYKKAHLLTANYKDFKNIDKAVNIIQLTV